MVTVEKLTEGIDKYMRSTLLVLYKGVDFVTKNNAVMKILDFQNNDTWRSPIHHQLFRIYVNNH